MSTILPLPTASEAPARKGVRLQLTQRGRAAAMALVFIAGVVVALLALLVLDIPSAFAGSGELESVTVRSGDTLWSYAERFAPEGSDPQEFIRETVRINDLSTARITNGQEILLPAGSALDS